MESSYPLVGGVTYRTDATEAELTAALELARMAGVDATPSKKRSTSGSVNISIEDPDWSVLPETQPAGQRHWVWARLDNGAGDLVASNPANLYALVHLLQSGLSRDQRDQLHTGIMLTSAFSMHRPLFDYTLTQVGRTARNFDPERHIADMARNGFTHAEVNALQAHVPLEPGTPHEYYAQFYSYCAGLNHFVDSDISRGYYPLEYLTANLNRLKKFAALARKYGMKPGILCFEPRSMPEAFFQRYPTLRGGRIDHPFRSHMPRYTLAQDHPVSKDHYRQMIRNLMTEVPDLAYLSVWTNDSGAGFEHTSSLYVGRNGGPYLIREWRSHEDIARSAATSALGWMQTIRDEAVEINPDFEVSLRLEPFKEEHDMLIDGMGNGLTVEVPSLLVRGYDLPYAHPVYPEQTSVAGSIFHDHMDDQETEILRDYRQRGFEPKMTYSCGSAFNTEPLLGIPFPRMLFRKLDSFRKMDALHASAFGGILNTTHTPYWPNTEVMRLVQLNQSLTIDEILKQAARQWVSEDTVDVLVTLWDAVENGVEKMPLIPLYSHFGFVWLRTWVRPLTPNLEAVPPAERAYFERFMVSTPNNPSINDLGQDVLFQLITQESGQRMASQFDDNVIPALASALSRINKAIDSVQESDRAVLQDLRDRTVALKCWATTQRNTVAWVAGVYGFLGAKSEEDKVEFRNYIQEMIDLDLSNTIELRDLLKETKSELLLLSGAGETSFIYGENIVDLLDRKIELTEKYRDAEPYIDRDIMWRLDFL